MREIDLGDFFAQLRKNPKRLREELLGRSRGERECGRVDEADEAEQTECRLPQASDGMGRKIVGKAIEVLTYLVGLVAKATRIFFPANKPAQHRNGLEDPVV